MMGFGRDKYIPGVKIDSSNNCIVLRDQLDLTDTVVCLAPGTYWLHNDPALTTDMNCDGVPLVGLYVAIADAINNSGSIYRESANGELAATISFSSEIPTGAIRTDEIGISINGTSEFSVNFDLTTLDSGWFGWPPESGVQVSSGFGTQFIRGPLGIKGQWLSYSKNTCLGSATDKNVRKCLTLNESHGRALNACQVLWYDDQCRTISYDWVPAAHVYENRAGNEEYATYGELAEGDNSNAIESMWCNAAMLCDVIIIHDEGDISGLDVDGYSYDIGRIRNANQRTDFNSVVTRQRANGELYTVSIEWILCFTNYGF